MIIILSLSVGFAFISFRPNQPGIYSLTESNTMKQPIGLIITSPSFENGATIPVKFTCNGKNVNPPLVIFGVPREAKSLALIMHDSDAPIAGGWTHWLKWNIPTDNLVIREGKEPAGVSGRGSGSNLSYYGPCPPSGTHRYVFKIYALDTLLNLAEGSSKKELESVMVKHVLGAGELVGLYAFR